MASAAASTVVESATPLVVERTMTWDQSGYGGHSGSAVDGARRRWLFAEGAQGYFDTFILLVNNQFEPATIRLTFLVEYGGTVIRTITVAPLAGHGVCRRHSGARQPVVRHDHRCVDADRRRARDVPRDVAGLDRRPRIGGRIRAVDAVVPCGRRDRDGLRHLHPPGEPQHGGRERRRDLPDGWRHDGDAGGHLTAAEPQDHQPGERRPAARGHILRHRGAVGLADRLGARDVLVDDRRRLAGGAQQLRRDHDRHEVGDGRRPRRRRARLPDLRARRQHVGDRNRDPRRDVHAQRRRAGHPDARHRAEPSSQHRLRQHPRARQLGVWCRRRVHQRRPDSWSSAPPTGMRAASSGPAEPT